MILILIKDRKARIVLTNRESEGIGAIQLVCIDRFRERLLSCHIFSRFYLKDRICAFVDHACGVGESLGNLVSRLGEGGEEGGSHGRD